MCLFPCLEYCEYDKKKNIHDECSTNNDKHATYAFEWQIFHQIAYFQKLPPFFVKISYIDHIFSHIFLH